MTLHDYRDQTFDLAALCSAAAELLKGAPRPADKRVNPFPDARLVRYYQSANLVDRPSQYQGRKAVYGYRHLLQACAVKLLQGAGRSLDEIQRGLAGRSNLELEAVLAPALGLSANLASLEPAPSPSPRPWQSVELVPGVLLSIDPTQHPNTEQLIARLHAALSPSKESE